MDKQIKEWEKIQTAFANKRLPQALFFVGPLHCGLHGFITKFIQLVLCKEGGANPCLTCPDCRMVERMEHPDLQWIAPEKNGGAIKIDQIRDLQLSAYLTPQRAKYRCITIDSAERMNNAAANALLKILEEPAQHTIFILVAEQLSSVLPTVLSRCQIIHCSSSKDRLLNNLLQLGEQYPEGTERKKIIQQAETILDDLIAVITGQHHPCIVAAKWAQIELQTMIWFLYLVYAQVQIIYAGNELAQGPALRQLQQLAQLLNPISVFNQIAKINNISKKLGHNMNINHLLALEDLLFSLV